jgi:octaprenyl-diphosphate synthase
MGMIDKLTAQEKVNRRMEEIFSTDHQVLSSIKDLILKSGGKRIRPLLHFFFARVLGYEGDAWIDTGAVGEMIHSASLLHDDVIDESDKRRGKPSANALHGNKSAVLAGDFLLSCALMHITTLEHSHELLQIFTRTVKMLSSGELIQMKHESDITTDLSVYDTVILNKTGSLFGAMTESSAVIAGISGKAALGEYRMFGEDLGRAFQIRDDYLDYFAEADELGKSPLQDYERGLVTRPVILLRDRLESTEKDEFIKKWAQSEFRNSEEGKKYIKNIMEKYSIPEISRSETDALLDSMEKFLGRFPASSYRKDISGQLDKLRLNAG